MVKEILGGGTNLGRYLAEATARDHETIGEAIMMGGK